MADRTVRLLQLKDNAPVMAGSRCDKDDVRKQAVVDHLNKANTPRTTY
jgi:hypothetical protein